MSTLIVILLTWLVLGFLFAGYLFEDRHVNWKKRLVIYLVAGPLLPVIDLFNVITRKARNKFYKFLNTL